MNIAQLMSVGRPPVDNKTRFWAFVLKTDTCWLWKGSTSRGGYGQFRVRIGYKTYKMVKAHVFSYEIHKGNVPLGKIICHSCDVPNCIRPEHLWAGTYKENNDDMRHKGRQRYLSGPDNPLWGRKTKGFSGRKHSDESRKKMVTCRLGKLLSEKHRANISAGLRRRSR